MTIQHDSMVHEGVCSTKCQHTQPKNDLPAQPMDGPHTQQGGRHAQTGAGPHVRTTHVRVYYHQYIYIYIYILYTLRFLLSVCPCVCDGCGRGRNEFAGRVQKHHVRFSFHRNGQNLS